MSTQINSFQASLEKVPIQSLGWNMRQILEGISYVLFVLLLSLFAAVYGRARRWNPQFGRACGRKPVVAKTILFNKNLPGYS